MRPLPFVLLILAVFLGLGTGQAAQPASDTAADPVYSGGWTNGSNGGSGWNGGWSFSTSGTAGFSIGSSTANNPAGDKNGDHDINTPRTVSGGAWRLYASGGGSSSALRLFKNKLDAGQTLMLDMDHGNSDQVVGFSLENTNGDILWKFYLSAPAAGYVIDDGLNDTLLALSPTPEGLHVSFTLTGAGNYSATITQLADRFGAVGAAVTIAGTLQNIYTDKSIAQIRLFNLNSGSSPFNDVFFNSMSIFAVPQITSMQTESAGIRVAWRTLGGKTNFVQAITGGYSNNWSDISSAIIVPGIGQTVTNYLDTTTTNQPSKYYRIRLSP